jgi:ABC-type glycerol-3-phosphate transport system permease component
LIGGQAIPIVMTILTTFLITRALHWLDTYQGAIIALTAQSLPFTIFLFYSYYIDLPRELLDAAEVDGASFWQVFTRIVLPMSGTIVATVGILIFIFTWATYLIGLVVLRKEQMYILSMVINNMEISLRLKIPVFFASFVMFSLPMIIVARWAQRYIATGMLAGAVKE